MDKIETGAAPAFATRHAMRFEGSGGEYFKIWIVNLALTLVTAGLFSAWAKVRNRRYFYGNTYLEQHAFDYHASPWRILLGRVIALTLLLGYSLSAALAPQDVFAWGILFVVALPWLVKSSLRFNARNTSYRNIRFDFSGSYGGAFKAFILWPILTAITLFTTLPLGHRARDYYNINNHGFGGQSFEAKIPAGKLYLIYLIALAVMVCAIGAVIAVAVSAGIAAGFKPGGNGIPPATVLQPAIMVFAAAYIFTLVFLTVFIGTLTFNLALNSTKLGEKFQLESTLSPFAMVWIAASNLVLTLVTIGLYYPWARVRQFRYVATHLAVIGSEDASAFASGLDGKQGAIGEEIASFFDIDFGL
jgi:uncharacterized membrane protein YjgN (DUF898 family)